MSGFALKISEGLRKRIAAHGVETFPYECCGALLGNDDGRGRQVTELFALSNRRDDSPRNRFEITPEDVLLAERTAREKKVDLIGWYHSHPNAPARPSEYDREHAWPWYSYMIVSIRDGAPEEMTSWRLKDDRSAYDQEAIESGAADRGI